MAQIKPMSKSSNVLIALFLISSMSLNAQIWAPDGVRIPGDWNAWQNFTGMGGVFDLTRIETGTLRWQTTFLYTGATGSQNFSFVSTGFGDLWGNVWRGNASVVPQTMDTYDFGNGNNNTISVTNFRFYSINFKDNGYTDTEAIFMETMSPPVEVSSVTQLPLASNVGENEAVTVTITTSNNPGSDEFFFVWYKIAGISSVVQATFTGNTGTAIIPGQPNGTGVSYYVISSTIALANTQNDQYYWMRSIKYSGQFSYTINLPLPGDVVLVNPSNLAEDVFPMVTFTWNTEAQSDTYDFQLATDAAFANLIADQTGMIGTQTTHTLTFVGDYYWRVRGVNLAGQGSWTDHSFETMAAATTISGNGGSSFGGPVGLGSLELAYEGDNIIFRYVKGTNGLWDELAIYIHTGAPGRTMIDDQVNDLADGLRRAISSSGIGGMNASELYFPVTFEASHAIGLSSWYIGLWAIPSTGYIGDNGLNWLRGLNKTPATNGDANANDFYFDMKFSDIGLNPGDPFRIAGIYSNAEDGWTSNEGYGFTLPFSVDNGNLAFTSYFTLPSGIETMQTYSIQEGNWANTGTWNTGVVPGNTEEVIIRIGNTISINDNRIVKSLGLNKGSQLVINPTGSLTVDNTLMNNAGNSGLTLESLLTGTASLLHQSDYIQGTVQRSVTGGEITTSSASSFRYHLISIPLENNILASESFMGSYLWSYSPNEIPPANWVGISDENTLLSSDKGYLSYVTSDHLFTFQGILANGTFTSNIASTSTGNYNLIPNPYPSAIDWDLVDLAASGLNSTIWHFDSESGNYMAYNSGVPAGGSIIPLGQSFFVQANAPNPEVTFNNLVRLHSTQAFYKANQEMPENVLHIHVSANNSYDNAYVRLVAGASNLYQPENDALKIKGFQGSPQLSTLSTDFHQLSINSISTGEDAVTVPVSFSLEAEGRATISLSGTETFENHCVFLLEDVLTGNIIDLKQSPTYSFDHQSDFEAVRFRLHLRGLTDVDELPAPETFHAWSSGNHFYFILPDSKSEKVRVELFDVQGKQLLNRMVTLQHPTKVELQMPGIVLLRITEGQNTYSTRLMNIKY